MHKREEVIGFFTQLKIMDYVKEIKQLLEELYAFYASHNSKNGGEMVIVEELGCYIYKGKELHYDANLIMYSSDKGIIKIDGSEGNNSIQSKSFVKIKDNTDTGPEVSFRTLDEKSLEFAFLNKVIEDIKNILSQRRLHR